MPDATPTPAASLTLDQIKDIEAAVKTAVYAKLPGWAKLSWTLLDQFAPTIINVVASVLAKHATITPKPPTFGAEANQADAGTPLFGGWGAEPAAAEDPFLSPDQHAALAFALAGASRANNAPDA